MRWLKLILIVIAILAIIPLEPYKPGCWPRHGGREEIDDVTPSEDFMRELKRSLDHFGVIYLPLGDLLLLRWLSFFDGDDLVDAHDALLNTELRYQEEMAEQIVYTPHAVSKHGYVYRHPEKLKRMVMDYSDEQGYLQSFCSSSSVQDIADDRDRLKAERCIMEIRIREAVQNCTVARAVIDANNWRPATREELTRRSGHSKFSR